MAYSILKYNALDLLLRKDSTGRIQYVFRRSGTLFDRLGLVFKQMGLIKYHTNANGICFVSWFDERRLKKLKLSFYIDDNIRNIPNHKYWVKSTDYYQNVLNNKCSFMNVFCECIRTSLKCGDNHYIYAPIMDKRGLFWSATVAIVVSSMHVTVWVSKDAAIRATKSFNRLRRK